MKAASVAWLTASPWESLVRRMSIRASRAQGGVTTKPLRSDGNRLFEKVPT